MTKIIVTMGCFTDRDQVCNHLLLSSTQQYYDKTQWETEERFLAKLHKLPRWKSKFLRRLKPQQHFSISNNFIVWLMCFDKMAIRWNQSAISLQFECCQVGNYTPSFCDNITIDWKESMKIVSLLHMTCTEIHVNYSQSVFRGNPIIYVWSNNSEIPIHVVAYFLRDGSLTAKWGKRSAALAFVQEYNQFATSWQPTSKRDRFQTRSAQIDCSLLSLWVYKLGHSSLQNYGAIAISLSQTARVWKQVALYQGTCTTTLQSKVFAQGVACSAWAISWLL